MTDILLDTLFYKVFHNKYIRTIIFSYFPIYVFENQSTECYGSTKWKDGDDNNSVIITENKKSITSGCWGKNPILFNQDLTISFDFQMITKGTPADGMAIVFLKDHYSKCNKFTRNIGGNLGYKGFTKGIAAIEFDIYNNQEENDPNDNHIAIQTVDKYTIPRLSTHSSFTLATASPKYKLNNGEIHRVNIIYNHENKSFSVVLNYIVLIGNTQIPELINHNEIDNVYIGITGSTGLYFQTQIVSNFQILKPKN